MGLFSKIKQGLMRTRGRMGAQMDELVEKAKSLRVRRIIGYYYPTAKNLMVKDFYAQQGFRKLSEDAEGNTVWEFVIPELYEKKQSVMKVNG